MNISAVVVVMGLLVCGSTAAFGHPPMDSMQRESLALSFGAPAVRDTGTFLQVSMSGTQATLYQAGKPALPMYTTTLQLPFGSAIQDVTICLGETKTMNLQKKISPAPAPYTDGTTRERTDVVLDTNTYSAQEYYPLQWFSYSTGGGLSKEGTHVTFFTIRVFPLRYSPGTDTLLFIDNCELHFSYKTPVNSPFPVTASNDLVIISPYLFVPVLEKLATHKTTIGWKTKIIPLNTIYSEYPGKDRSEQIKYFIKSAAEQWGTKYVLLVGGMKSHLFAKPRDDINVGTRDWHIPVRYTNIWDADRTYDPGFISDLYYADLYDGEGEFCTWDSDGDGVYGRWTNTVPLIDSDFTTDQIDFYPDVYLGRLPCRNIIEVRTIVEKIISYEQTAADPSWFKRMVVVGGDPYNDEGTNYLEGELIGYKALLYMPGFAQRKLFASNKDTAPDLTPQTENIIREINEGCGFLLFDGHGSPGWWNTFWPGQFNALIEKGGISIYQFSQLKNNNKLPICIIGGCHNNMFNVSTLLTLIDVNNKHFMWSNGAPIPECFGWSLTVKAKGGAIATIGNTALGYEAGGELGDLNGDGINEPDCVEALCGYLESLFFKGYGLDHIDILGSTWCNAIAEYLKTYPGMENLNDAKVIEQWILFGDPSLKIGGYPVTSHSSGI
jgi:hypothetical protein